MKLKGKHLRQAKIYKVALEFDEEGNSIKERPFTFDFNTLSELQDNGYYNPYSAIAGIRAKNFKSIKSVFHACLVSGQLAEDEGLEMDLSVNKVGIILGQLMNFEPEYFAELQKILDEAFTSFFPKKKEKEDKDANSKN